MAAAPPQNFQNHRRFVPLFHGMLSALVAGNLIHALWRVFRAASEDSVFALVVAVSLVLLYFYARAFALAAQDRVIRLEMRLRLERTLPADLLARASELRPRQLVALRFASDAELPGLIRDVLDGKLVSSNDIKKQIQNWQADTLRV